MTDEAADDWGKSAGAQIIHLVLPSECDIRLDCDTFCWSHPLMHFGKDRRCVGGWVEYWPLTEWQTEIDTADASFPFLRLFVFRSIPDQLCCGGGVCGGGGDDKEVNVQIPIWWIDIYLHPELNPTFAYLPPEDSFHFPFDLCGCKFRQVWNILWRDGRQHLLIL